jgi:Tfp pilus assembly ATPase PilU
MQTLDQALFRLYREGLIGQREALGGASRPEDLRIAMQSGGLAR